MSITIAKPPRPMRKIPWIPNQKGAWVMVILPYWVGVLGGGFRWEHLLIFALWIAGYSLFFTAENWLKARRAQPYFSPMKTWLLVTAVLAAITLWFCGALLPWALCFLPFIAVTAWQAIERKNRSLLARTAEVCAAGLMCLVAWDAGVREELYLPSLWGSAGSAALVTSAAFTQAMIVTMLLTFYFWSTIPFVKSLVRERTSIRYAAFSLLVHILGCAMTILCWRFGAAHGWVVIFWVFLLIRAVFFTFISHAPLRKVNVPLLLAPKKLLMCVGVMETFISVAYACVLLTL